MTNRANSPPTFLKLASQAIVPFINGCAKSVGQRQRLMTQKAIDYFGPPIAQAWQDWVAQLRAEEIHASLRQVGELSAENARREVTGALSRFATATPQDQEAAIDYLSAIPAAVARYVPRDLSEISLPWSLDRVQSFLGFLPIHVPPFQAGSTLANTSYRLTEVLGSGEMGVVYRLENPADPGQPRAVKFCLDNVLVGALVHEREHLNRLLTLGLARWSAGLARLYSYNLDAPIPFLVYEFCRGNDLTTEVRKVRRETGLGFTPELALELVMQVAGALAFVHGRGLVYCDLKPSNILIQKFGALNDESEQALEEGTSAGRQSAFRIKLTDFGTTAVTAGQVAQTCPISSREGAPLISAATHVRLLHGSNTSMYMSIEQRRGDQPEPHHDLYSLGVLWYQILVGDVTREIHPGWAEELISEYRAPRKHVEVMQRCLGYYKRRPADAADLLRLLQPLTQPEAVEMEAQSRSVSHVSERLRKLDERFARTGGMLSTPAPTSDGHRPQSGGKVGPTARPTTTAVPSRVTTEVLPKNAETIEPETLWAQETRILTAGVVPEAGGSPAQINRDAELTRLKRLLSEQLRRRAYQQARETVDVLLHLDPSDQTVVQARVFLAQQH
jgi:serine/threonine protein kinase